ncbi:WAG22 antigen-like [Drosophila gunungcola]|uniref:WAG22 antigen-like n=1 Tax=Drosophila gunungcola TaxID=103775 RepID=UPI0022DF5D5D|nr:WAG22 antigen-like [Drosophila gunungcola]
MIPTKTSKTATTAARIFSRLGSVEEVQRGRSGSAVGITPPGGQGVLAGGVGVGGAGSGAGTVAAAVVATGSPARSGQQQFVGGGGGVSIGIGGVAGAAAVGVAGAGGVAAVRQRSASTVLDINLPQQRKVSVGGVGVGGGVLAGPPSPVIRTISGSNGFSGYDPPLSVIASRHANFNGQEVGGGVSSAGARGAPSGAAHRHRHRHPSQQELVHLRPARPSANQWAAVDRRPPLAALHRCSRAPSDRAASRMSSQS